MPLMMLMYLPSKTPILNISSGVKSGYQVFLEDSMEIMMRDRMGYVHTDTKEKRKGDGLTVTLFLNRRANRFVQPDPVCQA